MKVHHIKKGYDIPIKKQDPQDIFQTSDASIFCVSPQDFYQTKPKLLVKIGDKVKIGSPLFFDKKNEQVRFVSPLAGKIHDISYGDRRKITAIHIEKGNNDEYVGLKKLPKGLSLVDISHASRESLCEILLEGGMWPYIRRRPFATIPVPTEIPDAIFINGMSTSACEPDPLALIKGRMQEFEAGLRALLRFAPRLYTCLSVHQKQEDPHTYALNEASGFSTHVILQDKLQELGSEVHLFTGKHPAGLTSTHIHHIEPLSDKKKHWYLNIVDVCQIGSFLLNAKFPIEKMVAVYNLQNSESYYCKTRIGVPASKISSFTNTNSVRIVSGNILTGKEVFLEESMGFYDHSLCLIEENEERRFLGWLAPGFSLPSYSRVFTSSLFFWRKYKMHTNLNGEERAFVKTGDYKKVMGLDVLPDFLCKAILAGDIEMMEALGIYEVVPEDFALCSYICPSKIEFMDIIEKGIDMMIAETQETSH